MNHDHAGSLIACLQQIPDPRGAHGRRHTFSAMMATIVCAVLCGDRGYEAIAEWIHAQQPAVWYLLGYFRKPPTDGAFRYLLGKLDPELFEQALRDWIGDQIEIEVLDAVAMDGKTLCGTIGDHGRNFTTAFDVRSAYRLRVESNAGPNRHERSEGIARNSQDTGAERSCRHSRCNVLSAQDL